MGYSMSNEKILARAKALLAMSQDASSEHEAMIAARRLHSLLAKHNISVLDLDDNQEEVGECEFHVNDWPWKRTIGYWVAKLYFCELTYQRTKRNYANYFVTGTEVNRLFAESIMKNVFFTIDLASKVESRKLYGKVVSSFVTSFRNGASNTIALRCNELIDQAKEGTLVDDEGNTLPILSSVYDKYEAENSAYMEKLDIKTSKSSIRSLDSKGYTAGAEAGENVQLSRSVQDKSSPKLLE